MNDALTPFAFFAARLSQHAAEPDAEDIFAGVTDDAIRIERIRRAILRLDLPEVIIGRGPSGPETYRAAFERAFGQALDVPRRTNSQQGAA